MNIIEETKDYINLLYKRWKTDNNITAGSKHIDNLLFQAFIAGLRHGNEFMLVSKDKLKDLEERGSYDANNFSY